MGGANSNPTYCPGPGDTGDGTCGAAYEYASDGKFGVLYNFCALANCVDGSNPESGLILDSSGNLLGTAKSGGQGPDVGTVFGLVNSAGMWNETVLYAFTSGCSNGCEPFASLTEDGIGDLFGTTVYGGAKGRGTVFELSR